VFLDSKKFNRPNSIIVINYFEYLIESVEEMILKICWNIIRIKNKVAFIKLLFNTKNII